MDIIGLFVLNIGIVVLVGKSKMVVKIAKIAKREGLFDVISYVAIFLCC